MERSRRAKEAEAPRSPARMIAVLRLLAGYTDGLTLATLSDMSRIPKTTLLSLMRALTHIGYLRHVDGRYHLGVEAFKLASAIVGSRRFPNIARPVVARLAEDSGETVLLAELDLREMNVVYVDKAESRNALRFIAGIGERRPLYCSAGGKIMLASQSPEWVRAYLRRTKLVPFTPRTITRKAELLRVLERVRREQFATTIEETSEGVAGFAAPVFNDEGATIAALIIGGPVSRALPRSDDLEQLVRSAADEISRMMGGDRPADAGGAANAKGGRSAPAREVERAGPLATQRATI